MDKKTLSESDICTQCITPAIAAAQWNTRVRKQGLTLLEKAAEQ